MKTRILLILLVVSSFSFAQTWNQVGITQFTDFSNNAELSFHPTTGEPYIVTHNPTNDEIKVKKFDGTNWLDVGATVSTQGHNNLEINFNPVTNEPWVALKRNGSGNASTVDVFRFDGTSWITEGTNILFSSGLYSYGIQLQFDASGNPRMAGVIGGGAGRQAVFATYTSTNNWTIHIGRSEPNLRLDFSDYDNYFYSEHYGRFSSFQGYIRKHTVLNNTNADEFVLGYYPSKTLEVSGISGTNYFVSNNLGATDNSTNPTSYNGIIFGNGDTSTFQTQPLGTDNNTNGILKFRESISDNNYYLMFSDASEDLKFEKFNGSFWSYLPDVGLSSNVTDFFVDMEINPVNGDMYIVYMDLGRASVKKFSIEVPLTKYYVNANVIGGDGSGDSWANAMTELSTAVNIAGSATTEIWVAAGTYKPGSANSDTFNISIDGLQIYGGFNGTETAASQRNILANPTILTGDINGNDPFGTVVNSGTRGDNSHHVMQISNVNNVVVDGVIIKNGHANGSDSSLNTAGGMYIQGFTQNLIIRNCEFVDNFGSTGGAVRAYFDINTNLTIENCKFFNNYSRYGSGAYILVNNNRTVTFDMTNCLFTNNETYDLNGTDKGFTGSAAWIRANGTSSNLTTTITNCTFANNTDIGTQASTQKGALSLARRVDGNSTHNATINNSIFYNNEGVGGVTTLAVNQGHVSMPNLITVNNSIDEDGFSNLTYLTNTSNVDPLFTSATDFTLQSGSPAIDTGDNTKVPAGVIEDLLGNSRIFNTTVDMGPYEFGSSIPVNYSLTLNNPNGSIATNPSGTSFPSNTIVELTAVPDSGYVFDGWSGGATGMVNPINITMDADKTVTATFSLVCVVSFTDANFKSALVANASINTNNDSEIQCTEAIAYSGTIFVPNQSLTSLGGIEAFANITKLFAYNNSLTTVDLSANSALDRIRIDNNMLTSINLSSAMVSLERLNVSNNPLSILTVSDFTALEEFQMNGTSISSIVLSANPNLVFMEAMNSNLSEIDLTQNALFATLYAGGTNLTSIDLRNGNLSNIGYVETDGAPNLTCIFVDDSSDATINNWLLNANNGIVETEIECTALLSVENYNLTSFNIYPNPTSSILNIKMSQDFEKAIIYNIQGQKILESSNKNINVSKLSSGLYLLKVNSDLGGVLTKRFIKN